MPATLAIEDRSAEVLSLYAELVDWKPKKSAKGGDGGGKRQHVADPGGPIDVQDRLRIAYASKVGDRLRSLLDAGDLGPYGGDASRADYDACCLLAFFLDGRADLIEQVMDGSALGKRDKWRDREDYRQATIENAIANTPEHYQPKRKRRRKGGDDGSTDGKPRSEAEEAAYWKSVGDEEVEKRSQEGGDERPEIEVSTERHIVARQTIAALRSDPDLYSRGQSLVKVIEEAGSVAELAGGVEMEQAQGSPRIVELSEAVIGCYLTRNAKFFQWKPIGEGEFEAVDCHPPTWLIRAVMEMKDWPGIRRLKTITNAPFIRPDGSLFESPGYDRATETLYRPSIDFPRVPGRPTKEDAQKAAGRLLEPFEQFPFEGDDDRAVILGGILTAIARPAIPGPVPGTALNGNRAGCGKGLVIDGIGIMAHGHGVPTSAYPVDPIEAAKVITAITVAGKPTVHLDNIEEGKTYGSPALDSALTSLDRDDRILGTSRMTGSLPWRAVMFCSGNNISPAKDAHRRWLVANLLTDLEQPEERKDIAIKDLRAHITKRRGELVRDALTILKAHADAGYPSGDWGPLGSFETWDRIVRGAVWFAYGRDCCASRRKAADESPDRLDKIALLEGWRDLPGCGEGQAGITAEKALEQVAGNPATYPLLHQALMRRSRDGKLPDARRLGSIIRGMKGSRIGGLRFEKTGDHRRSALWIVTGTPTSPPDSKGKCESGESGECDPEPFRYRGDVPDNVNTSECSPRPIQNGCRGHSPDSPDSHVEPREVIDL